MNLFKYRGAFTDGLLTFIKQVVLFFSNKICFICLLGCSFAIKVN